MGLPTNYSQRMRTTLAPFDTYREWLLKHEDAITRLDDKRTLWANTVSNLSEHDRELSVQRAEIASESLTFHWEWDGSFGPVEESATNAVDTARIEELASTVSDLRDEHDRLTERLDSKRTRRDSLQADLAEMDDHENTEMDVAVPQRKPLVLRQPPSSSVPPQR